jgi:GTPase-associated protein 1, N-terminal domain type 2/GTPase-associated protein 1, middle domain
MIRQLHYTSCRHGRDGVQGFQVAAATPGIPARHEDLGLPPAAYRPPPSAPAVPVPAALPVTLGFRDFGEVAVLFRSYYVGEDFTGRQGNYVAHLLLADQPALDLEGVVPAAAWQAPFWVRGPLPDGAGTTLPPVTSLPAAVGPGAEGAARDIGPWLDGHAGAFSALLAVVRDALAGRVRQVLLVAGGPDPAAEVAAAVLAVTASLPAGLARRVSFTTFTATPADLDLVILGTTPDVPLGSLAAHGRVVMRLEGDPATPSAARPSAYEQAVTQRWRSGEAAVGALRRAAARIRPPLEPDELDAFAAALPLLEADDTPGGAPAGHDMDPLPGVEFLAARCPQALGGAAWARIEAGIAAGVVRLDDLGRWSRVLAGVPGHRPVLDAAYLRAALARLASESAGDPGELWLPPIEAGTTDAAGWAVGAVEEEPTPATALRALRTLDRMHIDPADADLASVTELVLLPLVLDPDGDVEPFRSMSFAGRLDRIMADQLEDRLDDELVTAVAEGMSVPAARWLATEARRGGRVALAAGLRLAAAGERDPVELVVAHAADAGELDRLVALAWNGPPSAADGLRLLSSLDRSLVTGGSLTVTLAGRLVLDAAQAGTDPDVERLAARLDTLGHDLPEAARASVDPVLLTAWFRTHTVRDPDARDKVHQAVRAGCWAAADLAGPLASTLVRWLFLGEDVVAHAVVLDAALGAGMPDLLPAYADRLLRALDAAEPAGIVALLPALADVSPHRPDAAELLDGRCAQVLGRRRKKVLDEVGALLGEPGSVPSGLRPGTLATWTAWWKDYRETRIAAAAPELLERLRLFGRGG